MINKITSCSSLLMTSVSIVRWIVVLPIILSLIHGNNSSQNGIVRIAADCSAWYSEKNATAYDVRADWDTTVHLGSFDVCHVEVHGPCTGAKAKGTGKAEARSKNTIAIQGNPRRLERARWRSERSEIEADERKNKPNECDTYSGYVEVKLVEWQDEACRMELRVLDETKTRNEGKVVLEKKSNCAWDTWTQQEQLNIETEQEQQQQEHNQNQEPEREHEPNQEAETEAQDQKVQLQKSDKSEGNREMKGVRVKLDEGHYLVVELKVGNVVSWQRQADRSRFAMELGVTFEVDESETKAGGKCVKCVEGAEEDEEVNNELRFEGRHEQARGHAQESELERERLVGKLYNVTALGEVWQSNRLVDSDGKVLPIQFRRRLRRQSNFYSDIVAQHTRDWMALKNTSEGNESLSDRIKSLLEIRAVVASLFSSTVSPAARPSWSAWSSNSWNGWTSSGSSWNGWTASGSSWNGWTGSENLSPDQSNTKSVFKQGSFGSSSVVTILTLVVVVIAGVIVLMYKMLKKDRTARIQYEQEEQQQQDATAHHVQHSSSAARPVQASGNQSYGLQQAAAPYPASYPNMTANRNDGSTLLASEIVAEDRRIGWSSMPFSADSHSCEVPLLGFNQHLNETLATTHLHSTRENVDAPPSFEEAVRVTLPTHEPSGGSNLADSQPPPYEQAVKTNLAKSNNELN